MFSEAPRFGQLCHSSSKTRRDDMCKAGFVSKTDQSRTWHLSFYIFCYRRLARGFRVSDFANWAKRRIGPWDVGHVTWAGKLVERVWGYAEESNDLQNPKSGQCKCICALCS